MMWFGSYCTVPLNLINMNCFDLIDYIVRNIVTFATPSAASV